GNRVQGKVNSHACSTINAAKVKQVPLAVRNSVVEDLSSFRKHLRKLLFQVLLGRLRRRQNRIDLEIVHGAKAANAGANQNVGGGRLQLFAGEGVKQDLRRPGDGVESAGQLAARPSARLPGHVDGNRQVGAIEHNVVGQRVDEAAVDQRAPVEHHRAGEAR